MRDKRLKEEQVSIDNICRLILKLKNELEEVRLENKKLRHILNLPIIPEIVKKGLDKV